MNLEDIEAGLKNRGVVLTLAEIAEGLRNRGFVLKMEEVTKDLKKSGFIMLNRNKFWGSFAGVLVVAGIVTWSSAKAAINTGVAATAADEIKQFRTAADGDAKAINDLLAATKKQGLDSGVWNETSLPNGKVLNVSFSHTFAAPPRVFAITNEYIVRVGAGDDVRLRCKVANVTTVGFDLILKGTENGDSVIDHHGSWIAVPAERF